jgi:hypothetical protein
VRGRHSQVLNPESFEVALGDALPRLLAKALLHVGLGCVRPAKQVEVSGRVGLDEVEVALHGALELLDD